MSIVNRLEKLETVLCVNRCPACGAPEAQPVILDATDDALPDAQAGGLACSLCGATPRVIRIVDEDHAEAST